MKAATARLVEVGAPDGDVGAGDRSTWPVRSKKKGEVGR
jgi:hypothetical protein